nr:EAL domain-containing protein [Nitrosophilus alvini]
MEWVKKIKKAINYDRVVPYFQPIFDNRTGSAVSFECLMRMTDENYDLYLPGDFLEIAKKSRLYSELTKKMVTKCCEHFQNIDCKFSINLSVDDILNEEVVWYIKDEIKKYKVEDKIVFEIVESEGIEEYEEIAKFISDMKKMGCKIAVDDFGTGYSNFEHLLKLQIDYIKIDASLIKNLEHDKNAEIIVKTIVDFANRLGIGTVAEFVSSDKILAKVKKLGIGYSQGFFLGKPAPDTVIIE